MLTSVKRAGAAGPVRRQGTQSILQGELKPKKMGDEPRTKTQLVPLLPVPSATPNHPWRSIDYAVFGGIQNARKRGSRSRVELAANSYRSRRGAIGLFPRCES